MRRWWTGSALAAVFAVSAYIAQVELGNELATWAHIALLAGGSLSTLLAFLLPIRYARKQQILRLEAQEVAEQAVSAYRLQTRNVLAPMCQLVGLIAGGTDRTDREKAQQRLQQMILDFAVGSIGRGDRRASFFQCNDERPREFQAKLSAGRDDGIQGRVLEGTPWGDTLTRALSGRRPLFIPDVSSQKDVEGYRVEGVHSHEGNHGTLVCCPVVAAEFAHGVLILDSVNVGDLDELDARELGLFASLLAAGLSAYMPPQENSGR